MLTGDNFLTTLWNQEHYVKVWITLGNVWKSYIICQNPNWTHIQDYKANWGSKK